MPMKRGTMDGSVTCGTSPDGAPCATRPLTLAMVSDRTDPTGTRIDGLVRVDS
jgi:hypothetical protein